MPVNQPTYSAHLVHHFGWFFHQIKVRQPKGSKDFIQTVIRISRRLYSFLYEAAQNSDVFSNIQNWNTGTTLMQIQSGSGRIRNFLPDPESGSGIIILDPDPGSPDKIHNMSTYCTIKIEKIKKIFNKISLKSFKLQKD